MSFWDFLGKALPAAASIGSAFIGSQAAERAANTQVAGANDAAKAQLEMFNVSRGDIAPYRETGTQALFALSDLYGVPRPDGEGGFTEGRGFEGTPGYQFRLNEGIKALDRSAAARGKLRSGQHEKALVEFGQNAAAAEFGDYANRLATMAGIGQTATGAGASLGANAASNIGQAYQNAATARASGYVGGANAINQGAQNLLYLYGR